MEKLIEALQIFLKYGNPTHPTHCEHDVLHVAISPSKVSEDDMAELGELGFFPDEELDMFRSFKFGSC